MTDRDRLIELIYMGLDGHKNLSIATMRPLPHFLADGILADGWIRQPCKRNDGERTMTEHIELLEKEISTLEKNLEMAKKRPGVREEEILNIEKKIRLKMETAGMLAGMVMAMKKGGGGNEPENT